MYNIKFFRKDPYLPPQWKWELLDIVPRKKSLLVLGEENTFNSFKWNNLRDLKKIIIDNSIDKVVMVSSNLEGVKFYNQNYISSMSNLDWLALERTEKLKNKTVYIFDVTVL